MPRSVIVTGAADGIGRGIATAFAQCGDRVALLDYDRDKLERTAAEISAAGGTALGMHADVRDAAAVDDAVARAAEAHDGVDVAINNAAVYPNTPVVDMAEDEWDLVLDTNLKGAFLFTRAAARHMIGQGRGGKLCLIASGAYTSSRPGSSRSGCGPACRFRIATKSSRTFRGAASDGQTRSRTRSSSCARPTPSSSPAVC